jgi:hypothetical protein
MMNGKNASLMSYEHVPVGFEIVVGNKDFEMGKIWNLWFSITFSDDPAKWDDQIVLINGMQKRLGELSLDQRLIRAQMAELCRRHPTFPHSLDVLCKEIGLDRFSEPLNFGCEGRGLLQSLGYHSFEDQTKHRNKILREYVQALEKWLVQGSPSSSTDYRLFGYLGQMSNSKKAFARQLLSLVSSESPSIVLIKELAGNECDRTQRKPFWPSCFKTPSECWPKGVTWDGRLCCFLNFVYAGFLCAGMDGDDKAMRDEFLRFIEENVLAYSFALNFWLKGEEQEIASWLEDAKYVSMKTALQTARNVQLYLGKKTPVKEWLAACLLKTVKDNHRRSNRVEPIDHFPEATDWFAQQ